MKHNTLILGDSYSTFEGHVPEGYAVYYYKAGRPETDVSEVSQTWWYPLLRERGLHLLRNDSYSGSTICYTGYDGEDYKDISFITRLRRLIDEGFFTRNPVDTVLIFGGTNDSWADAPLGEASYSEKTEEELYRVLPAVCCFTELLRRTLPRAEIFFLLNTGLKEEINDCIRKACQKQSFRMITFDKIRTNDDHPTVAGMKDIKDRVSAVLESCGYSKGSSPKSSENVI